MSRPTLPTAAELVEFVRGVLPETGLLGAPGPRTPSSVVVYEQLAPACSNPDESTNAIFDAFGKDERPFLERQIERASRPSWKPVLDAPWVTRDKAFHKFTRSRIGRIFLIVETPLLSADRKRGVLRLQQGKCTGVQAGVYEDFQFFVQRDGDRWKVEAVEIEL